MEDRAATTPRLTFSRRTTTRERQEEILQVARARAESMENSEASARLTAPLLSSTDATTVDAVPQHGYQTTDTVSTPRRRNPAQPASTSSGTTTYEAEDDGPSEDEDGRFSKFLSQFRSVELENKGSVARDHLALERTFLAWLRTSLAFTSIGIAITQLFRLNTSIAGTDPARDSMKKLRGLGKPLGATFVGISIVILFLGYQRYFRGQQWIMKGKFPASRGTIIVVAFMAFSLMATSLVVVIVAGPSFKEV